MNFIFFYKNLFFFTRGIKTEYSCTIIPKNPKTGHLLLFDNEIELENGKIKSTTGHLFMVKDKWWKAAAELKAGDILETQIVRGKTIIKNF